MDGRTKKFGAPKGEKTQQTYTEHIQAYKNNPTEKVLRERYLVVEREYQHRLARPKRRRKSPVLKKCEDLMEILWEDGYRKQITWHKLREYIEN